MHVDRGFKVAPNGRATWYPFRDGKYGLSSQQNIFCAMAVPYSETRLPYKQFCCLNLAEVTCLNDLKRFQISSLVIGITSNSHFQ